MVTNNGPQPASAVVLTNELPPELVGAAEAGGPGSNSRLLAQLPAGCAQAGTTATCELGDLAVGGSRTLVFDGTVRRGTRAGTALVLTATVSFDGTDAVEENNTDADTILVVAQSAPTTTTTTTTSPSTTTTTSAAVTTTTITPTGPDDGGNLPVAGAAIAGLLAVAAMLIFSGGGLQGIAARPGHDDARSGTTSRQHGCASTRTHLARPGRRLR